MDAFEKWADDQWYRGKGENAPNPNMILIAKSYEEEARKAFRAGMRAAAEIVAERARKGAIMRVGDPVGLTKLRDAILAEADK